ncbi:MAG: 2-hydroxyacyl-CoA dehydratase [Candidatus Pacearchaeota archaeon]|jgi:predicted nucleotide-binding protein (sugar kinase/HSP70/actin superfamily)
MKIMLPYYNDLTVLLSTVFKEFEFDIDYVGRPNKETIELATKHAPESWCFDLKLILGQAIAGAEKGDNILALPGSWGRGGTSNCILGYLTKGVMQKKLEKITKKKAKIWFFNVNPSELIFSGYTGAYKNLAELREYTKIKFSRTRLLKAIVFGTQKMDMAAKIKEEILNSANVIDKKRLFLIYNSFIRDMIFKGDDLEKSKEIFEKSMISIKELKRKELKQKLTVGIIGDYSYTLFSLVPFLDIEEFLLSENVTVKQPLSFMNYYNVLSPIYSKKNREESSRLMPQHVAGSNVVTILTSLYLKDKVDGLIHVRTFGCVPEDVANEVLINNKDEFPPMLSLSYDAHTTEENLKVRIEAFIDMLITKKSMSNQKGKK